MRGASSTSNVFMDQRQTPTGAAFGIFTPLKSARVIGSCCLNWLNKETRILKTSNPSSRSRHSLKIPFLLRELPFRLLLVTLLGIFPLAANSEVLEFNNQGERLAHLQVTSGVLEVDAKQRSVYQNPGIKRIRAVSSSESPAKFTPTVPIGGNLQPSRNIARLIEKTALKYSKNAGIRKAGLTVLQWQALFQANIQIESAYKVNARSPVGAIGLGQLMPATAKRLGVNPHDVADNLDGSARYLLKQLNEFGSPQLALAAYNAGPQAVQKYGGIPPYRETQGHVRKVMAVFQQLGGSQS